MKTARSLHATAAALVLAITPSVFAQTADAGAGAASDRRVVVVGVARPRTQLALMQLGAPGQPARPLRITCDAQTDAAVGIGSGYPTVSPDGNWIAYTRAGLPYLRRVAGGRELSVMPPGRRVDAEITFTSWSPDSARLLYHLHEVPREEGPTAVLPAPEGFYTLEVATMRHTAVRPTPESIEGWVDASSLVMHRNPGGGAAQELVRVPLDGSARTTLSTLPAAGTINAIDVRNAWVAFTAGTAGRTPGDSRVEVRRLDGTGAREVSSRGMWADYQFPRLSPDGAWVVYERASERHVGTTIEIAATSTGAARTLTSCLGCRYTWESPTSLIVLDRGGMRRVALDGTATPIALPGAARVTAAGDP